MILNIVNPHASYYLGGTEVVTLNQALSLAKRGHTVRYFTRQPDNYSDYFEEFRRDATQFDVEIIEILLEESVPYADGSWPLYYYISSQFGMAAQAAYAQYDDADLFVTHLSADALFLPSNTKNVIHLHGTPSQTDALMSTAMTRPNLGVAHSTSIQSWWGAQFPKLPMDIFRNGIDTRLYAGLPDEPRIIDVLYVGRFLPHKGIDDILQAVSPDMTTVIAGHGPYLDTLKAIAKQRNLTKVTFIDTPSTVELRQLYASSKLFVCPSRAKEGVLTTMLEASSSGCAIVTASGSGMTDLIVNGKNGRVIAPSDILGLADTLTQLLANDSIRHSLARQVQSDIQSSWSWDSKATELEQIYEHALKS